MLLTVGVKIEACQICVCMCAPSIVSSLYAVYSAHTSTHTLQHLLLVCVCVCACTCTFKGIARCKMALRIILNYKEITNVNVLFKCHNELFGQTLNSHVELIFPMQLPLPSKRLI